MSRIFKFEDGECREGRKKKKKRESKIAVSSLQRETESGREEKMGLNIQSALPQVRTEQQQQRKGREKARIFKQVLDM